MPRGAWFRPHKRNGATAPSFPDGLWIKCPACSETLFSKDVERNLKVCPKCGHHHRLTAGERIELTVDPDTFRELDSGVEAADPLAFPGYTEKLSKAKAATGLSESVVTGCARIEGRPLVIGVTDFSFMAGSMGSAMGEKVVRAMERGLRDGLPVVLFTASGGGARMYEGILSLMQMAKTSAAAAQLDGAGIPLVVVLTDATMAGVFASFASLADIALAEPGALIGFAGRRVGNQDVGVKLPDDFQTSEFQFRCGMIDRIVARKEMRSTLATLLAFFGRETADAH